MFINFDSYEQNQITEALSPYFPVKYAASLFYSVEHTASRKLLHRLKYQHCEYLGAVFGDLLGEKLSKSPVKSQIDIVIPIPIHAKTMRKRGYNQVHKFAKKLSEYLESGYAEGLLVKSVHTRSQVFATSAKERWKEGLQIFKVTDQRPLCNKHILLVDDLMTTGSTLKKGIEPLKSIPGIVISVATIAVAKNDL